MSIEIAIFASVIFGVVAGLLLENMRRRIEPAPAGAGSAAPAPLRLMGPSSQRAGDPFVGRPADSAADLRLVSDAGFASKPLLSGREADVLAVVESIAAQAGLGWRVVPQVRLVDIIASSDADANAAIGDHRIDMLIVSAARMPVAAVDYQPLGQLRDGSALRDAVKREALRRADIPFLEARANEPLDTLREQILRLAAPPPAVRATRVRAAAKPAVVAKAAIKPAAIKPATIKPAAIKPAAIKPSVRPAAAAAPAVAMPPARAPAARGADTRVAPKTTAAAASFDVPPAAKVTARTTTKPVTAVAKPAGTAKSTKAPKDPPAEP